MALEPITRQEKIIAGQDLTPITRMEKFLKDFGGGGVTSWNDLKDRPFYETSLISVSNPLITGAFWYKVSDAVPTGDHSEGASCITIMDSTKVGFKISVSTDDYYAAGEFIVFVALTDNAVMTELDNLTFPEKGTYFLVGGDLPLITGFALGANAKPEITWDGSTGEIKKLDEKFLPDNCVMVGDDVVIPSSTEGSTKKFKITVDDTGTISATEVT